jgi:hypothetical protein
MIVFARKTVENIIAVGKKASDSEVVKAGKTLPGYRTYEQALEAQVEFKELSSPFPQPKKAARKVRRK